jgi:hypothetical protein
MLLRKATLLFSVALVATLGFAAARNDGTASRRSLKKNKKSKNKSKKKSQMMMLPPPPPPTPSPPTPSPPTPAPTPPTKCVTKEEAELTVKTFTDVVVTISQAFFTRKEESGLEAGCLAAYEEALGALNAAYAYNIDTREVLFKPTYTGVPYTYRNTLPGALSYFIGTECLNMAAPLRDGIIFPPGNEDGSLFQEFGFGLNNYRGGDGWVESWFQDFDYLVDDQNCKTAIGLGRVCFKAGNGNVACVDKTFSFINSEPGSNQLPAILTSHHSSATVVDDTITICQNPVTSVPPPEGYEGITPTIIPDLSPCSMMLMRA